MALDGAKFVCLSAEDDGGSPASGQLAAVATSAAADVSVMGRVVEAKGRKFTVGYYMNCDYVLDDQRAKGVHCEIQCDAFGRVTIHNLSEEHPISVNEQIISIKRPLLHGSRIRILDKEFLWKFPKNSAGGSGSEDEDLVSAPTSTPQKSAAEQPPSSCPHLKLHRSVTKRFTVHNFAYCIQSDEEGNTSADTSHIANTTAESAGEVQTPEGTPASTTTEMASKLAPAGDSKSCVERCVTPEAVAVDSHLIDILETPKLDLINCTKNKENKSTEKKQQLLSLCHQSDVVITSFSPRETGVRIEKSFTAVLKPAATTPKSVYSTPKSVLSEYNDDGSRDCIDFSTPATSKKTLSTRLATNSSMHLIDLTTPTKLRPASPQPKTALKSVSKRLPELTEEKATSSQKAAVLLEEGISALPASPVTSSDDVVKKDDLSTPGSAVSVISVDGSTDNSSVIELSGEDSTPGVSGAAQNIPKTPRQASSMRKVTTPMRTPQSLMKRAILTSAKKQASAARLASTAASAITPARKGAVGNTVRVGPGTSSSQATPKSTSASTKAALALKQRQSLSATSRRSLVAQKLKLENSPRGNLSAMEARAISTSTPLQQRIVATSSSVAAKLCNTSPLHGVRKSIGNSTLPSHISKTRKSIVLAGCRTPPSLGAQLVAKARKSLCAITSMSNSRSRNLVAAAVSASSQKSSPAGEVSGVPGTGSHTSCEKQAESTETQEDLDSNELSRTFVVDDSFAEEASTAALSEIVGIGVEKNAEEHKDITFSPAKNRSTKEHELNRTFSSENLLKLEDPVTETPIDVAEVNAASPTLDMVPTDVIKSVELFDEPLGNHNKDTVVIAENFAESVELVTSEVKSDDNVGSTAKESAPLMNTTNAVNEPALAKNNDKDIETATAESPAATDAEATPCGSKSAAVERANKPEEEEIAVESTTETVESLTCVNAEELELTKAEIDKKQTLLETAPDTNNISSTTHTATIECVEDSAPLQDEAQVELEAVVETIEEVTQSVCLSTVSSEAEPDQAQDVQSETLEETANSIVPMIPTASEESAAVTANVESALDQKQDVKNESETANSIVPVTPSASEETAAVTENAEPALDQNPDVKNDSETAISIVPVTPTASKKIAAVTENAETALDQKQDVKNESERANSIVPVGPSASEETAAVTENAETALDQKQDIKNESETAISIVPVTPSTSEETAAVTENAETALDQKQDVKNESETAISIVPVIPTASDETALNQDQDIKNKPESANGIVPVTLTDADEIPASGESEETAMLLEEIEYVLNKSDELQQKQSERYTPDPPPEHSKEVSNDKPVTQEDVVTIKNINKPEIDQETTIEQQMRETSETEGTTEEAVATKKTPSTKGAIASNTESNEATLLDADNVTENRIQSPENNAEVSVFSGTENTLAEKSIETPPSVTENFEITAEKKEEANVTSTTAKPTASTEEEPEELPHEQPSSPLSPNLCGVRELLQTPTRAGAKTPVFVGLRHLVRTPKAAKSRLDSEDADSFEALRVLLKTPHHSKKRESVATSTPHAEPTATFTPRRSARRRASATAEITPTLSAGTPRRTTRRRASESSEPLSTTLGTFTPKRITTRRPSLSLDEDATLTPHTRSTRSKRLLTLAENAEDMGAIVEEAPKDVTDVVDKSVTLSDATVEVPPKDVVQEEHKSKTNEESAVSELQVKVKKEIVAPLTEIIEESICEEVQLVQRVADAGAAPVEQETVAQSNEGAIKEPMTEEAPVVEDKKIPSVKDIETQEVEDDVRAADCNVTNRLDHCQSKSPEQANSPAEILDESDYEYGKEVIAAKQLDSEPATTSAPAQTNPVNSSVMDAQTPKSRKVVKFEEPSPKTPVMVGVREMLKTPKAIAATPKLLGVRDLVRTPKSRTRPDEDDDELEGLAELVKTPKGNAKAGTEEESPSTSAEARLAYLGMREMLKTPKYSSTPLLKGVREMMQTPKACSTPQLAGIKQLMETPNHCADGADMEQPFKQDLVVAAVTDLNETVTEGLDKFFKTPRAKNMMIPGLPPSAVIEQNTESVGLMTTTEYDLNATPGSAANLEDIFKTPVSTRFVERITDSCAMDSKVEEEPADDSVEEITGSVTPVKEANSSRESKNLSAEEAFDELIGQASQLDKTPTHKVYSRKSHTSTVQPSPFSASDVVSDLPRTDIQEWVDSLETEEPDSDYAADATEHEISVTPSMLEHGAHNASRDPIADSTREQSTCIKAETLINVSVASSAVDPLLGSVCKAEDQTNLQTVEEEASVRATTPVESEMSGINLLDQTNESIFSEPLLVSDSDSVDENIKDEKEEITETDIENVTLGDDEKLEKIHIGVDEIAPKKVEGDEEKDKENVEATPTKEKSTENVEGTKPHNNVSDEKDSFPIMLIDSDTDSSVIEETPAKRGVFEAVKRQIHTEIIPKVGSMQNTDEPSTEQMVDVSGTRVVEADGGQVENEPNQDITAEFDNFQENAIVLCPRSSTPDQRKARAKLSRKTLGAEEDLQLTLDLELEKAELEKARLIELCAKQATNKAESAVGLYVDEGEQGKEEKKEVIEVESNVDEKIAEVEEVKLTDKENDIICLDENEDVKDKTPEEEKEEELASSAELVVSADNTESSTEPAVVTNEDSENLSSNVADIPDSAESLTTECKSVLNAETTEPVSEYNTDESKAAEKPDLNNESSIVGLEEKKDQVRTEIDTVSTEDIITPLEVTAQIIEDIYMEGVVDGTEIPSPKGEPQSAENGENVDSTECTVQVAQEIQGDSSEIMEVGEKLTTEADIFVTLDETKSTSSSNMAENLAVNESQLNQPGTDSPKTAVSENVECVVEVSTIPEETKPTSSVNAAENNENVAVNKNQPDQSTDSAKTVGFDNLELVAEVKVQPTVVDDAEEESTNKNTLETELAEVAPTRRDRKGSRSKQHIVTNDEQTAEALKQETVRLSPAIEEPLEEEPAAEKQSEGVEEAAHNEAQIFISTDYEIKIESSPESGPEVEKEVSEQTKAESKVSVDDTNAEYELSEVASVDAAEQISTQLNTHSSSPVTECVSKQAISESLVTEPIVAAETKPLSPPTEVEEPVETVTVADETKVKETKVKELVETVTVADETKVRKRTRKGSQSSQCSNQDDSLAPKRRVGRRKAGTPIEVIADSSNSSDHTELSTVGGDLPKRRRGNKKVEPLLEEVGEDVRAAEEVEQVVVQTILPGNEEHRQKAAVEVMSAAVAIGEPTIEVGDGEVVSEDRLDHNNATIETVVEKEPAQKRSRRKAPVAEVSQHSSFVDSNEASTSRRRRGRKNTEESNGDRMLDVQKPEVVSKETNKHANVTKDNVQDDAINAATLDTATSITSPANEEDIIKKNEREVAEQAKKEELERHTTPEATKRQYRERRNRQLSVTITNDNEAEVRPTVEEVASVEPEKEGVEMKQPIDSKKNAKTAGGRARTTRRKHEEVKKVADEEITDGHEEKELFKSASKPSEETTEEASPKEKAVEEAEKSAPRRRGARKAKDPNTVELPAPKRRGGKRRLHEELTDVQAAKEEPVSEHDSTAVRAAKVIADLRRKQEELESELHDAPGGDETEEDHDHGAVQTGRKRRRAAVTATAVAKRAVRGRAKKDDHLDESKPLEDSLLHTTTQPDESTAHVMEMAEEVKTEAVIQETEIKSEMHSLKESQIEQNDSIKAQELKPEMEEQKAVTKPKGRKRRDSHVELAQAENLEHKTETKPTGRKRRESHIEHNEIAAAEEVNLEKSNDKTETKEARGRKRRESVVELHPADSVHTDEPPHKRGAVDAAQIEIDTKPNTPENVKSAPRRTRKASALDSSQHSAHELDLSTGTPRRMRSRNVPRRAATAQDHNYDESSDTEAQAEFKRRLERREHATTAKDISMTEKPTTSRGRTRKPTAIVQQYLEEERAKAGTPKRRLLLTPRNETPTSESRHVPARRGRKASTIEIEALGTPQSTKRGRGKLAAATATQATEVSEESRSEIEHASEQEETQSSHTEEKEVVPRVPSRSQARRRGKAVQEHEAVVEAVELGAKQPVEAEPHEGVTAEVVSVQPAKRGRARGRARTASADTAAEVATVAKETDDKPKSSTRGRGTRARTAKPVEPVADEADVQPEAEQHEARRMASASTVVGSINEEDLLSVGIVAGSDSQMDVESVVADEEDEDKPLATVTAKPVKRTAAVRKVASSTDSPAPKRGRRKAAAADVAHTSDETEANTTARSAGGRGRKVVRFEPADGVAAATAAATAGADLMDAAQTVEPTEAAAAPPKRVTRTRRK